MSAQDSNQYGLLQLLLGVAVVACMIALAKLLFEWLGSRDASRLIGAFMFEALIAFCAVRYLTNRPSKSNAATIGVCAAVVGVFVLFALNGYFNGFYFWDSRTDAGIVAAVQSPVILLVVTVMGGCFFLWPPVVVLGVCAGLAGRFVNQGLSSRNDDRRLHTTSTWHKKTSYALGVLLLVLLVVTACAAVSPRLQIRSQNMAINPNAAPYLNPQITADGTNADPENAVASSDISGDRTGIPNERVLAASEHAVESGRSGIVGERLADGSIGPGIDEARLIFIRDDGQPTKETMSGSRGRYKIQLSKGWYRIKVTHDDYKTYSSGRLYHPGEPGYQAANFFLQPVAKRSSK